DRIEVELEDLLLAQRRFEAEGEDRLTHLAPDIVARILEQIFGDLLGNRRPALGAAAAGNALSREINRRAEEAGDVDSVVLKEILVLGGDEGVDDQRRVSVVGQLEPPRAGAGL